MLIEPPPIGSEYGRWLSRKSLNCKIVNGFASQNNALCSKIPARFPHVCWMTGGYFETFQLSAYATLAHILHR